MNNLTITDVRSLPGDSAFLLDDGVTAVLYDSGFAFTGYQVADNIAKVLGDRPLDYIFLTHAVLVNSMIIADNLHSTIFSLAAYTVILCFSLFKSGALAKSIFSAHQPKIGMQNSQYPLSTKAN